MFDIVVKDLNLGFNNAVFRKHKFTTVLNYKKKSGTINK